MVQIKPWLQLFRAQTWPATMLLIMTPYLHNASFGTLQTQAMFLSTLFFHYLMFGQNSLLDTTQGYDLKDPAKAHHPLVSGVISLTSGHKVIHWGLAFSTLWAGLLTLQYSPNPSFAMLFLLIWVVFGWGYNLGLSKESLWGWVALDIGYTGMGAWAWLMSHETITRTGLLYLGFAWFTLMFQITWEGFLKDIELDERSNLVKRLGGMLGHSIPSGVVTFDPGLEGFLYAWGVKILNFAILYPLVQGLSKQIWYTAMGAIVFFFAGKLILTRVFDRSKELLHMSLEEVATIYLVVPIMLPWSTAVPLMILGVVYFFGINIALWGKPYPRV